VVCIGIDVGGPRKGFHGVALDDHGACFDGYRSQSADEMARWCHSLTPRLIGIDAPCAFSVDGMARAAERQLMQIGIFCFASPTQQTAFNHPTRYHDWMLNGVEVYRSLETRYPLLREEVIDPGARGCFETFPHAIACGLAGRVLNAREKRRDRSRLLGDAGIDLDRKTGIDWVDAALCALTAHHVARGHTVKAFGNSESGWIRVPWTDLNTDLNNCHCNLTGNP
jgi:predicted nuclease with RNAse H fold